MKKKNPLTVIFAVLTLVLALSLVIVSLKLYTSQNEIKILQDEVSSLNSKLTEKEKTAEVTKTPTKAPSKTPMPTKTPTPTPTAALMGDLEDVLAGTLIEEAKIDYSNLDTYFVAYPISDTVFERIYGDDKSYKTYCNVPITDLRYVKVLYTGFDGYTYVGELIVNAAVSDDIVYIFKTLFENKYPICKMVLVDEYGADDDLSIADNNTSAFNYRNVTGGDTPSNHAFGVAIDINPINNPYIWYDDEGNICWEDPDANLYLDRDADDAYERHMINTKDLCYKLFTERGWTWGGSWAGPIDYQHFEKTVVSYY